MMRAGVCATLACAACGTQTFSDDIFIDDASCCVERPDSTTDASSDVTTTIDAGPKYNGGGPFTCVGCICDGTQDMCFQGSGGLVIVDASDDGDADAAPICSIDAGQSECIPIPLSCLPKPDCACINQGTPGCACSVSADGNGFMIKCPPHP